MSEHLSADGTLTWQCDVCGKTEVLKRKEESSADNPQFHRPEGWRFIKDNIKSKLICSVECTYRYTSNLPKEDRYPEVGSGKKNEL